MSSVQILAQPTTIKLITGETIVAYAIYAKIPEDPSEEDLDVLDALDIADSMFVFVPSLVTHGNDATTFTPWVAYTDLKVFRIERGDIMISSPLSIKIAQEFEKYIASQNVILSTAISNLFKQLGLDYEEKTNKSKAELIEDKSIQYLAELNKIETTKH